ncbi:MAG TPA: hypothetical protein VGE30_00370 [Candidatus Saccharimonadales bacterium]
MIHPLQTLDDMTNGVTMYKGVLWGVLSLLAIAELSAVLDVIGINPLGLIVSVVILAVSCYGANYVFARLFRAAPNSESWLITALILACILNPKTSWSFVLLAALCGAIAMASKYVITWRGSHIFNPAAFGAFVVSTAGLLSANWWIATPALLPVTAGLAFMVLRKQRRFTMFFTFMAAVLVTMLLVNIGQGREVAEVAKDAFLSWPLVFLGSVMLAEPVTLPADTYAQLLVAVVVGVLFGSQLEFGSFSVAPHTALLVGNMIAAVIAVPFGTWLVLRRLSHPAPDIIELVFTKPKGMAFRAGQYMEWTLPHTGADIRGNRRTFTIASAPAEDTVRLAVRTFEKSSSYKTALARLKPGNRLRAANISGQFTLPSTNEKLLFIAGGIGITPFRSMIVQLQATKRQHDIVLVYLASDERHFLYKDLFAEAAAQGLKTHYLLTQVAAEELQQLVPDAQERLVYISGPNGMVRHYDALLRGLGVARGRIRKDHFSGY